MHLRTTLIYTFFPNNFTPLSFGFKEKIIQLTPELRLASIDLFTVAPTAGACLAKYLPTDKDK